MNTDPTNLVAETEIEVNISLGGTDFPDSRLQASRALSILKKEGAQKPVFTLNFSGEVDCKIWNNTLHTVYIAGKLISDEGIMDGYLDVNAKSPLQGLLVNENYKPDSWGATDL
jgi:hypothetical protein